MVNPECLKGDAFLNKFLADYENLTSAGFSDLQAKKMLAKLDYVKDFVDTPEWLECAKKLPGGCKWSDGTRFNKKAGKKSSSETYTFLAVGNDLYIKGMLDHIEGLALFNVDKYGVPSAIDVRDKRICLIRNWKKLKSHKVTYALDAVMTPFLENSFHRFWNDNGGKMSMQQDDETADMIAQQMFLAGGEHHEMS